MIVEPEPVVEQPSISTSEQEHSCETEASNPNADETNEDLSAPCASVKLDSSASCEDIEVPDTSSNDASEMPVSNPEQLLPQTENVSPDEVNECANTDSEVAADGKDTNTSCLLEEDRSTLESTADELNQETEVDHKEPHHLQHSEPPAERSALDVKPSKLKHDQIPEVQPTLTSTATGKDAFIDLDSDCESSAVDSGVGDLIKRFVKHSTKKPTRKDAKVEIKYVPESPDFIC